MRFFTSQRPAAVLAGATLLAAAGAAPAAIIPVDADSYARDATARGDATFVDTRGFAGADFVSYVRFDLSDLNIDTVTGATLNLYKIGASRNDGITTGRFEVQGLSDIAGNTPQDWDEATFSTATVGLEYNATAANSVDLARVVNLDADDGAVVTETVADAPTATTLTGSDLVSFLNARADAGGLVTFVISVNANNDRGYGFASKENADATIHPTLDITFTAVPEPAAAASLLGMSGLALLAGRRRRRPA